MKSQALKKKLAKEISSIFKGGLVTEFKKNSDWFVIKKYWKRNEPKASSST